MTVSDCECVVVVVVLSPGQRVSAHVPLDESVRAVCQGSGGVCVLVGQRAVTTCTFHGLGRVTNAFLWESTNCTMRCETTSRRHRGGRIPSVVVVVTVTATATSTLHF